MSQSRKRAISFDGDGQDCNNKSRNVSGSRPLRPVKRKKLEDGSCGHSNTAPEHVKNANIDACMKAGKVKRQVWTDTAIEAFSEGLCQHGKNFHRILKFMQTKYKKKNDPVIPNLNKDQVRFYYYRTWHKVSALLTDPTQPSSTNDSKKSKSTKSPCGNGSNGVSKERKHQTSVLDVSGSILGGGIVEGEGMMREGEGGQREVGKREERGGVVEPECEGNDGGKVVGVEKEIGESEGGGEVRVDVEEVGQGEGEIERRGNMTVGDIQDIEMLEYTADNDLICINDDTVVKTLEHTTEVVVALESVSAGPIDNGISCSPNNEHCTEESNDSQSPVIHLQNPLSPGEGTALNIVSENGEEGNVMSSVLSEEEDEGPLDSSMEELASSPSLTLNPIITTDTEVINVEIKAKENLLNDKVVSRRDSVRGDTVIVNGARYSLDLVALIAYFKLKKKCQADHNFRRRLSELVYLGCTTIPGRTKGRRKVQIKLRNCRALQPQPEKPIMTVGGGEGERGGETRTSEYNPTTENPPEVDGPSSLITPSMLKLELRPLTSSSWQYVQSLSQNPRLRMTIESTLTLKQLQTFLLAKWKLGQDDHYVRGGEEKRNEHDREEVGESGKYKGCHNTCKQQIHLYHTHDVTNKPPQPSQSSHNRNVHTVITSDLDNGVEDNHTSVSFASSAQDTSLKILCKNSMQTSSQHLSQQQECIGQSLASLGHSDSNNEQFKSQLTESATEQQIEPANCMQVCCCCSGDGCNRDSGTSIRSQGIMYDGRSATPLNCSLQSTFITIHHMFHNPAKIQLLYEVLVRPDTESSVQRLKNVLKIATALSRDVSESTEFTSPPCHKSPVVTDYLRSLPRRSPWKSPLSKYRRIKQRSSRKHFSPKKLNFSVETTKLSPTKDLTKHTSDQLVRISSNLSPSTPCDVVTNLLTPSCHPLSFKPLAPPAQEATTISSVPSTTHSIITNSSTCVTNISTAAISTPSLSHLLTILPTTHSHPLHIPSLSSTIMSLNSKTSRKPITMPSLPTTSSVNSLTLPKSSIGHFDSLNLQGLFSVATGTLSCGNSNKKTTPSTSDRMKLRDNISFSPGSVKFSDMFNTSRNTCVSSSAVASTCINAPMTTSNVHIPKTVSVQVVSSVKPRPSTIPPTTSLQQHKDQSVSIASVIQSPIEMIGVVSQDHNATVPSSSPPTSIVSAAPTTSVTVSQPTYTGISSSTLALLNSMRRNKRHKMQSKKTMPAVPTRQIVPRPLPFGQNTPSLSMSAAPTNQQVRVSSQQPSATNNPSVQQQLISLLQTLVFQQQQRKQQQEHQQPHTTQQPSHDLSSAITKKAKEILQMQSSLPVQLPSTTTTTAANSSVSTISSVTVSNTANTQPLTSTVTDSPDIPDSDIEAAILNNFLSGQATSTVGGSHPTSQLFHTSSDTVDQLLRGLSTKTQTAESIIKLSQDTACVLPTFARALQSSMGFSSSTNNSQTTARCIDVSVSGEAGDAGVTDTMIGVYDRERTPAEMSDDTDISGDHSSNLVLSDVLVGSGADDSTFQQLAQNGNILDGLEFPMDILSQLPATPPRTRTDDLLSPPSNETDISIGSLLDFLVSPEKDQNKMQASSGFSLANVDPTYRSLLEDTSVDYIQKFRELASQMNSDQ